LSITSAVAQNSASSQAGNLNPSHATQPNPHWDRGSSIAGTIKDQNGAVIPNATIYLSNQESQVALYASTGFDGQFKVDNLQQGFYILRIEAPGFAPDEAGGVYVRANEESRVDRTLSVATIEATVEVENREVVTMGVVSMVSPEHPFVRAAQEDNLETLTSMIAGLDVNLRDKRSGTTALEHAVKNGNREMVQLLLSHGAAVNAKDESGDTVLMMLNDDATSDLMWDLLNAGADLKLKDKSGTTALMQLASSNNVEALKTLLDAGAEVNAKNKQGQTALMLAASEGLVNNVRALVLAGADINAIDEDHMNALAHATENDHRAVVRFLKSKGAVETEARVRKEQ